MGGKGGGGGGGYYVQPPSTTGYGSAEEAKTTLARESPLDLSARQGAINARKAAAAATAPAVKDTPVVPDTQLGEKLASSVLPVPGYLEQQRKDALLKPRKLGPHGAITTTGQT